LLQARPDFLSNGFITVQDSQGTRSGPVEDFFFGQGNILQVTKVLQVNRGDSGYNGHVGRGDFRKLSDFSPLAHSHFQDGDFLRAVNRQYGDGKADLVVEFAGRFEHPVIFP